MDLQGRSAGLVHWCLSSTSISPIDSRAGRPTKRASYLTRVLRPAATAVKFWHLLSLDAPTVAVVWCGAFAMAAHTTLPATSYAMLFLATWGLYVADRLLDGIRSSQAVKLQERHHFHARHRIAFLLAGVPAAFVLAWLVATRMNVTVRWNDLLLALAAGFYLLCVHLPFARPDPSAIRQLLSPKELSVAVIFAIACIIPAWSRQPTMHAWLFYGGIAFALLCWLNCVAIETWESIESPDAVSEVTGPMRNGLRYPCAMVAGSGVALALIACVNAEFHSSHAAFAMPAISVAVSAGLLYQLDRSKQRLSPLYLRAMADAVLLTPAVFLLLASMRMHLQ